MTKSNVEDGIVSGLICAVMAAVLYNLDGDATREHFETATVLCAQHKGLNKLEAPFPWSRVAVEAQCNDGVVVVSDVTFDRARSKNE